jgi:pilus assembly protein CpaC
MHANARAVINSILVFAVLAAPTAKSWAQTQPAEQQPAPTAPAAPVVSTPESQPMAALPPTTAAETQSMHILVGRSVIISTQARLRRILVSNPNVLSTVTVSPTQVVVSALTAGSSSLVLWDEQAHARLVDVYADLDVSGLRDALAQGFPGVSIQADAEQGRVVLSGTVPNKATADEAVKISGSYSKEVVNSMVIAPQPRPKQIMLKVRFAEVNRAKLSQFGINILSTGAANTPGVISTGQFGSVTLGQSGQGTLTGTIGAQNTGTQTKFGINDLLNVFLFRPDLNLGITMRDLQQKNVLQILAEPNLMARDGEPAKFLAGGEFPYPVVQGGVTNTITIQFRPYGVKLDFVGNILDNKVVRLKVSPEVSALDYSNAVTISGYTVPAISSRRAETVIELKDGQSFGIAGLLDERTTAVLSKVPGIGDVPILGHLFRSKSNNRAETELMVLVTPVIVDPAYENTPPPVEPKMPLDMLKPKDFDKNIEKESSINPISMK